MFRLIHQKAVFEESAQENWTNDKDLNPLVVDRLGYRSNSDIILDFVRSGELLTAKREGYLNNDFDEAVDYFEDMSRTIDNLLFVKNSVTEKFNSIQKQDDVDLSTDGGKVKAKPNEKGEAEDFSTDGGQVETESEIKD